MQIAKLTANGQITIPEQIRKKLNLKTGDKIIFFENDDDNAVTIANSSVAALRKFQAAMEGEAQKAGIMDENDVIALCADVRKELYEKKYADS